MNYTLIARENNNEKQNVFFHHWNNLWSGLLTSPDQARILVTGSDRPLERIFQDIGNCFYFGRYTKLPRLPFSQEKVKCKMRRVECNTLHPTPYDLRLLSDSQPAKDDPAIFVNEMRSVQERQNRPFSCTKFIQYKIDLPGIFVVDV